MWFCMSFIEVSKIDSLRSPVAYTISKLEANKYAKRAFDELKDQLSLTIDPSCIIVQVKGCACCQLQVTTELILFSQMKDQVSANEQKFTDWKVEEDKVISRWNEAKVTVYLINDQKDIMFKFASSF